MFYQSSQAVILDGAGKYLDLTGHLHRFLNTAAFSADIVFETSDPGYPPILAVYFKESLLPDFSLSLWKGRGALTIRRGSSLKVFTGGEAVCDGKPHRISFRGKEGSVQVWMDGQLIIEDEESGPWCRFGYVGFATLGRGTRADQYTYFRGTIHQVMLSCEEIPLPKWEGTPAAVPQDLFSQGMAGVENYRIPSLLTAGDTTIASADARLEAPGDNPNHICRAVRLSHDSGKTWSDVHLFCDYGGKGRDDGAAAIDGSLLYDEETDTLFQLFSHTSRGVGAFTVSSQSGFDGQGRKRLWDREDKEYYLDRDGKVYASDGTPTEYSVGAYGRLLKDGRNCGSICRGENRVLRQADVSFLQLIESHDKGETWSDPVDLNAAVKASWMRFVGAGPGTGIRLRKGPHKGRLLFPVYYHNQNKIASSGAIYSDDHGKTWVMGGSANDGRLFEGSVIDAQSATQSRANLGECQIAEQSDGTLTIFLRNSFGKQTLCAYSCDGGESWYGMQETGLQDPQCQSHVLKVLYEGREILLFSNPADPHFRVRGTVRASFDDGKTWPVSRLIEPGEFGYSCMSQLPDGQIGILYEGRDISQRFVKFPLEWLLEGK